MSEYDNPLHHSPPQCLRTRKSSGGPANERDDQSGFGVEVVSIPVKLLVKL